LRLSQSTFIQAWQSCRPLGGFQVIGGADDPSTPSNIIAGGEAAPPDASTALNSVGYTPRSADDTGDKAIRRWMKLKATGRWASRWKKQPMCTRLGGAGGPDPERENRRYGGAVSALLARNPFPICAAGWVPQELDDEVHDTFVVVVLAIRRGELRSPSD
jgi:hypothetical protein